MDKPVVILVHPQRPENIGFVARAMKTQGFTECRIVGPEQDLLQTNAKKTAYASHEILSGFTFHPDLEAALEDIDLSVGTSAKPRTSRDYIIPADKVYGALKRKEGAIYKSALVFGSEQDGLSKEEINLCDWVTTIPMSVGYPSLNLSQSVLIYLYEFNRGNFSSEQSLEEARDNELHRRWKTRVDKLFRDLEFDQNPAYFRKLKDRANLLSTSDMEMLMSVLNKLRHRWDP